LRISSAAGKRQKRGADGRAQKLAAGEAHSECNLRQKL
jgi:hypothetical protein